MANEAVDETSQLFRTNRTSSIQSNDPTFYFLDQRNASVSGSNSHNSRYVFYLGWAEVWG